MANDSQIISAALHLDQTNGYYAMIGSMVFFHCVNRLVSYVGVPISVHQADSWKWKNLVVSWIHALITGVWDLACFVVYPNMFEDLLTTGNYFMYYLVAFSTGYFVYDFLDMVVNRKVFKMWEVTLHHFAVTSMFWYNLHCRICIAFNCVALLAEVNSFFLHSRKLLQMIKVDFDHWFYRITVTLNLITFAVFRGASLIPITIGLAAQGHRVTPQYYYTLCSSMFFMNVMHPILFWRLLRNDFLRSPSASKKEGGPSTKKPFVNGNNNLPKEHLKAN